MVSPTEYSRAGKRKAFVVTVRKARFSEINDVHTELHIEAAATTWFSVKRNLQGQLVMLNARKGINIQKWGNRKRYIKQHLSFPCISTQLQSGPYLQGRVRGCSHPYRMPLHTNPQAAWIGTQEHRALLWANSRVNGLCKSQATHEWVWSGVQHFWVPCTGTWEWCAGSSLLSEFSKYKERTGRLHAHLILPLQWKERMGRLNLLVGGFALQSQATCEIAWGGVCHSWVPGCVASNPRAVYCFKFTCKWLGFVKPSLLRVNLASSSSEVEGKDVHAAFQSSPYTRWTHHEAWEGDLTVPQCPWGKPDF